MPMVSLWLLPQDSPIRRASEMNSTVDSSNRYRREPSFGAGFGWEAASISHPGWNAPDAMTAKRRILEAPIQSPLGEPLPFDSFGDVKRRVVAHVVRNGRFEVLE